MVFRYWKGVLKIAAYLPQLKYHSYGSKYHIGESIAYQGHRLKGENTGDRYELKSLVLP